MLAAVKESGCGIENRFDNAVNTLKSEIRFRSTTKPRHKDPRCGAESNEPFLNPIALTVPEFMRGIHKQTYAVEWKSRFSSTTKPCHKHSQCDAESNEPSIVQIRSGVPESIGGQQTDRQTYTAAPIMK